MTTKNKIAVLAYLLLLFLALFLLWHLIASASWCIEQWGVHERALNCLWVENTLFGRWIQ